MTDRRATLIGRQDRSRDSLQDANDPLARLFAKPGLARLAAEKACGYLAQGSYMRVPGTDLYAAVVVLRPDQHWMREYLNMRGFLAKQLDWDDDRVPDVSSEAFHRM